MRAVITAGIILTLLIVVAALFLPMLGRSVADTATMVSAALRNAAALPPATTRAPAVAAMTFDDSSPELPPRESIRDDAHLVAPLIAPAPAPPVSTFNPHCGDATPALYPAIASALASAHRYPDFLQQMWRLCGPIETVVDGDNDGRITDFQRKPAVLAPVLDRALRQSTGVARQHLIFHIAIALPRDMARDRLLTLLATASADNDDREDAFAALAFVGDVDARNGFRQLAPQLPRAAVRRWVDTPEEYAALEDTGDRDVLRSYRCFELLARRTYFHIHAFGWFGAPRDCFPWSGTDHAMPTDEYDAMLAAWLARYPGHPGSDDMLVCRARIAASRHDPVAALRLATEAASAPDQDMLAGAVGTALFVAEVSMPLDQLAAFVREGDATQTPSHDVLTYVVLRRTAAEGGFANAIVAAARLAHDEPASPIGRAFGARMAEPPPRGLDSGVRPLPPDDPLRTVAGLPIDNTALRNPSAGWSYWWGDRDPDPDHTHDLWPSRDAVHLPLRRLARQFRVWCALADLESRAAAVAGARPDEAADLRYKCGAICYHAPELGLFPAYALPRRVNAGLPVSWGEFGPDDAGVNPRVEELRHSNATWLAIRYFRSALAVASPAWPGADKARFSLGLAHIHLVDAPAMEWCGTLSDRLIRRGVYWFEQCADHHPASTLSDDALSAARYWRNNSAAFGGSDGGGDEGPAW